MKQPQALGTHDDHKLAQVYSKLTPCMLIIASDAKSAHVSLNELRGMLVGVTNSVSCAIPLIWITVANKHLSQLKKPQQLLTGRSTRMGYPVNHPVTSGMVELKRPAVRFERSWSSGETISRSVTTSSQAISMRNPYQGK